MKKIKSLIAIIVSVIFVFGITGCGLITKTPEGKLKTVVAKVNGEKITLGDYQERLQPQITQYESLYGSDFFTKQPEYLSNLKTQTLTQMVQETLMLQKASELKLTVDDKTVAKEVDDKINQDIKSIGGQKAYADQLKKTNFTPEQYKALLTKETKVNDTIQKLYNNITGGVTVTDQEVTNYYYQNQYKYTVKPDVMNVSHILLKTNDEAKKVYDLIKNGMKFEDAAKKYSTDTGTKDKGGSLGDIDYTSTDYVKEFMDAALTTPTGKVSLPVKSQYGYHLIKINSRHEYKVKPLDSVKADIKKSLQDSKKGDLFNNKFSEWESKAKIEQHPELL